MNGPAFADTLIAPGLTASGTLTAQNGTFSGSITFTNTSQVTQGLVAFSLQLFDGNSTISNLSVSGLTAGWESFTGKQNNAGTPCNQTGNLNWFCTDGFTSGALPFTMGVLAVGSTNYSFSGTYTGTPVSVLDLMANGCNTTAFTPSTNQQTGAVSVDCIATKWAYSDTISGTPTTFQTPEPTSAALLLFGLTATFSFFKKQKS